ncbi:MAG: dihydropteroate synthase [Dehalococcoidales bacterium]|nr:dihydropteroate synthase [Dehalococcoidales bacterium]
MTEILVVGELINSTRKAVKAALEAKDASVIRRLAREQVEAGADIIDVNTATSMEHEVDDMKWVIGLIHDEVGNVRLSIDSPSAEAMASGLELCQGRPLINSINNDPRGRAFIDIVKRFDGDIIGLPMGGKVGVPRTVEERLDEVDIMLSTLDDAGVDPSRLYIDSIVMTIGSNQEQGRIVIESVREIKKRYGSRGVKTSVGLSNISFGLPRRSLINQAFLAMLLEAGLDMALIDPRDVGMISTMRAAEAIVGTDAGCLRYIKHVRKLAG